MKKFKCTYLKVGGGPDYDTFQEIEASGADEAAQIYAHHYPSKHPRIDVSWGVIGNQVVENPAAQAEYEEARAQEEASRIKSLKEIASGSRPATGRESHSRRSRSAIR